MFSQVAPADNKVVVIPLGGDDIGQCELSSLCDNGVANLTCPSGVIEVPCEAPKKVFVTSTSYTGDLGGIAGADMKCMDRAAAGNLPGTYRAWLSVDLNNPVSDWSRTSSDYVSAVGGEVIFDSRSATFNRFRHQINKDEFGEQIFLEQPVWTNTSIEGSTAILFNSLETCDGFTSSIDSFVGVTGSATTTRDNRFTDWTFFTRTNTCDSLARLYCFEQ